MSIIFAYTNTKLLLILSIIILISPLKIKINGRQKDYCFTKSIYAANDTIRIFYIVSSGKHEKLTTTLKNPEGKILYEEETLQKDEYTSDVLPSGDYMLCFEPHNDDQYYISFDIQVSDDSSLIKDLAKDKEVKGIKYGVLDLERLFNDFEKNLKFIVDRRNHHHTILQDVVGSIKTISAIKILVIIFLSLVQVFIITKFFGADKRVSTIKAGTKDLL